MIDEVTPAVLLPGARFHYTRAVPFSSATPALARVEIVLPPNQAAVIERIGIIAAFNIAANAVRTPYGVSTYVPTNARTTWLVDGQPLFAGDFKVYGATDSDTGKILSTPQTPEVEVYVKVRPGAVLAVLVDNRWVNTVAAEVYDVFLAVHGRLIEWGE